MKFLDKEQRQQIGFNFVMDRLEVMTPYGVEEKKEIKPFKIAHKDKLLKELDNTEKVIKSIQSKKEVYSDIERVFCKLKDVKSSIKRCKHNEVLDDIELYEIKYFSLLNEELVEAFNKLDLQIENIRMSSLEEVIQLLDPENKRIPTFYIYDEYSKRLKDIRKEKTRLEHDILTEEDEHNTVLLKEQRLDVVILEEEEEHRIRKELTDKISDYAHIFEQNMESIGKLDLLMAKAGLSIKYNGVKPVISKNMELSLKEAHSPEIEEVLNSHGKSFTPVSIDLTSGTTVITGANMGGKSVTLKTIVLNLLLAQMGLYVFAKEAKLPVLDFIHFISDDMQNISKGLSTFGAEIIKLKEVIECVKTEEGFLALDEFARGTNPKEGYYLVKSLCKYLTKYNSISLISTHYDGVVEEEMIHYQVVGLKNVSFDALKQKIDLNKKHSVEIIQENMEYRLERVSRHSEVPKDALNISILLGLDEELINIAKNFYIES